MRNLNSHRIKKGLESVEDSKEYGVILQEIAREAGEEAVLEAKILKIPITYLNASRQVVKEFPDGRIEIIKQLPALKTHRSFAKGTVLYARKG
ncbi:MAG: hypothetical protein ACHQIM_02410 [Sphingobacteriales bacterium]|jgi:hypothetical protein|nr:hypothetical protein [Mucilaginibacter sp.]